MKFRIGLTQRVFEEATVEVEAETAEAAERAALALVDNGAVEWQFLESAAESTEIVSVESIEAE